MVVWLTKQSCRALSWEQLCTRMEQEWSVSRRRQPAINPTYKSNGMVQPLVAVCVTEASSSPQLHYGPHRLLNQRTRHALPSDARTPMNFTWLALATLTGTAVPLWIREYVSFSACRCLYISTYSLNYRLEHSLLLWMFRSLKLFVAFAWTNIFTLYNINFHFEIHTWLLSTNDKRSLKPKNM